MAFSDYKHISQVQQKFQIKYLEERFIIAPVSLKTAQPAAWTICRSCSARSILFFRRQWKMTRYCGARSNWKTNDNKGKLRLGEGVIEDSFWDMPAPEVPMGVLQRAIEEDRNED